MGPTARHVYTSVYLFTIMSCVRWFVYAECEEEIAKTYTVAALRMTRNPKLIWEEPRHHLSRQRITTQQSPHWLQLDASHLPQNCFFPFDDLHPI